MGRGFGAGVSAGLSNIQGSMIKGEEIKERRKKLQMLENSHMADMVIKGQQVNANELAMQEMQAKLEKIEKDRAKEVAFNAFDAYEQTGDTKYLNNAFSNPKLKVLLDRDNVRGYSNISDYSPEKLEQLGFTEEMSKDTTGRYVVIDKNDGTKEIGNLLGTYATTGYLGNMRKEEIAKITKGFKESQAKQEATKASAAEIELTQMKKFFEDNPTATIGSWKASTKKGSSGGFTPFSIQTAEYFGGLKSKIDAGTATTKEKSTYDAYLLEQSGSKAAESVKTATDTNKLKDKGIDLTSPTFDLDSLDGKDKVAAQALIRDLENTTSGKALVKNIQDKLGKGLGSVQSSAKHLSDLATKDNIKTDVLTEAINQAKAYLPEGIRDMTAQDLKDAEFRQSFLSVTAVFLKLQSGLTVSDREAARFAQSMGTMNKNIKVNMTGLKTKLDELIGDYEMNKGLAPTLYNAKYRKLIDGMKKTSATLDEGINKPPEKIEIWKGKKYRQNLEKNIWEEVK